MPASLMDTTCASRSMTSMSNTNMAAMKITKPTRNNTSVVIICSFLKRISSLPARAGRMGKEAGRKGKKYILNF